MSPKVIREESSGSRPKAKEGHTALIFNFPLLFVLSLKESVSFQESVSHKTPGG